MSYPVYILIMLFLVVMSGYFSATETAFSTMNKTRLKTLVEEGNKRAKLPIKIAEDYNKLISTVLIGNNIVNIALSSIATVMFIDIFKNIGKEELGATVSTAVITVVVLIFGEITPKNIAKDIPESFAMFSAPFLSALIWLFTPFTFLFGLWKQLVTKIFKTETETKTSSEELLMYVEEVQQEGSLDNNEGTLIKNAIEFNETKAEDILTHRMDLEAVSENATKEELSRKFVETKFSRILVYRDTIDNIIGVVHQKDFYTASGLTTRTLAELIAPVLFIQKNEKISDLLKLLQKNKAHIAVVLDEYGGTLGIVTMEDILEELVGDIWDEHDEVVETFKEVETDVYRVDCSVNMDDFCDYFAMKIESESVSLGGFIMELFGKIPEVGESVEYIDENAEPDEETGEKRGLYFTVAETDLHRITLASVRVLHIVEDEEDAK